MKVIFLGEYSSFYKNLAEGLRVLGHNAEVASAGDGWKKIHSDIDLSITGNTIIYRKKLYQFLRGLKDYQVVQLINQDFFPPRYFPYRHVINTLLKNNEKMFLSAAGDDAFLWRYGRQHLRYGHFEGALKDWKKSYWESSKVFSLNKYIADKSAGVIPIMYEYEIGYSQHPNLRKTIPLPINTAKIKYSPNVVSGRLVIFHGITRYWTKGTNHVEKAFEVLERKYPNDLDLRINEHLPLNEYLNELKIANVIIDQTSSYSCGMNALFSLAMGKIVMGGAEPESLVSLGISQSPVVNILPDSDDIVRKIEFLLENRSKVEEMGFNSRKLIEEHHDYIKVAQQYVREWMYKGNSG